ncbi:MAG: succinylglutamate desuccinylase/aspartoacylase family protein [Alphaproteobacteria bacterium]|nr:succinylglutamate desuccinylase/aspartoacylase family protein [Alphaproteobacteria bacterium]
MSTASYAIELRPPDIRPYRVGNAGIDYVLRFASATPGPHVLVTALVHGNELCGAIALDFLLRKGLKPRLGTLTLAFCNTAAFFSFDEAKPTASRFVDEDFNRVWGLDALDGPRSSVELQRARALRPVVEAADFLLDIHSMQHATAPLMLCGPLEKGRRWARRIGYPTLIVSDQGHAAGRRMRDYGGFGDPASPKNAQLVECGQHWEAKSADVAIETMLRTLVDLGTLGASDAAPYLPTAARPPARVIEITDAVTIRSDRFVFAADYRGLEVIAKKGTVLGHDGDLPVVTPYDACVLIMPTQRLVKGQTAVRLGRYVD